MTTPHRTNPATSGFTLSPGEEWTSRAANWPVRVVSRETEPGHWLTDVVPAEPRPPITQLHLVCTACPDEPSVFCLSPDISAPSYTVDSARLLAGIVAHLRRSHE